MYSYKPLWETLKKRSKPQKYLYEEVGLARGTVTKMSKGGPVSIAVLDRICTAMNIDISQVVDCGLFQKEEEA